LEIFQKNCQIFLLGGEKQNIVLAILKINLTKFSQKKAKGKRGTWIWQTWKTPKQLASTQDTWAPFPLSPYEFPIFRTTEIPFALIKPATNPLPSQKHTQGMMGVRHITDSCKPS
jgi:hypothetical protein